MPPSPSERRIASAPLRSLQLKSTQRYEPKPYERERLCASQAQKRRKRSAWHEAEARRLSTVVNLFFIGAATSAARLPSPGASVGVDVPRKSTMRRPSGLSVMQADKVEELRDVPSVTSRGQE